MFARTVFDLMFFIIVLVLLLNLIFGIILDTFSDLRAKAKEQNEEMTRCAPSPAPGCVWCSVPIWYSPLC